MTTVAASELFGATSHTAVGTVIAAGAHGSIRRSRTAATTTAFAVGLIASSGAIVIPPSIAMILYAVSGRAVGGAKLFTAGNSARAFSSASSMPASSAVYARIKGVPLGNRARWETIWKTTKDASWSIGTLAVIFGVHYGGVFTPTEAAACGGGLFGIRHDGHLQRGRHRSGSQDPGRLRLPDFADSADRDVSRHLPCCSRPAVSCSRSLPRSTPCTWQNGSCCSSSTRLPDRRFSRAACRDPHSSRRCCRSSWASASTRFTFGIIVAVNLSLGMYTPPFGLNLFSRRRFSTRL